MNHAQAIALATTLRTEAADEDIRRVYTTTQAANHDQWAVLEMAGNCTPIQLWVSPELSFPL